MLKNNIIILGCGSSGGVPTIETGWGNCDPKNPKNYRKRASILLNIDNFNILIDTTPDLRQQALEHNIKKVDCIFYTHEHSDHISGIDDIRSFNRLMQLPIDCYLDKKTFNSIQKYVFQNPKELAIKGFYRPALIPHIIKNNTIIKLNNNKITVKCIKHLHGSTTVMGYIFNQQIAYITDILDFTNNESLNEYKNLDIIIISACVLKAHRSHMTLYNVIEILLNILKPKRAYLTHMAESIDFETQTQYLKQRNISNIFLCYDGLHININ